MNTGDYQDYLGAGPVAPKVIRSLNGVRLESFPLSDQIIIHIQSAMLRHTTSHLSPVSNKDFYCGANTDLGRSRSVKD